MAHGVRCACGRSHAVHSKRRRLRRPSEQASRIAYEALCASQGTFDGAFHQVALSGDCSAPQRVSINDTRRTFVRMDVRCRRCSACLRARTNYWGFAALHQTELTQAQGLRTWFGTLTLTPAWQEEILWLARENSDEPNALWWEEPKCEERFRLVREVLLKEVQKYWKRLRKAGHAFNYLVVFERHKSGLPHMHFLLHEKKAPVRKKDLQIQWHLGFSNCTIVGGKSSRSAAPERAAWYVVKYLSKSSQSRQLASAGYRPKKRSLIHNQQASAASKADV